MALLEDDDENPITLAAKPKPKPKDKPKPALTLIQQTLNESSQLADANVAVQESQNQTLATLLTQFQASSAAANKTRTGLETDLNADVSKLQAHESQSAPVRLFEGILSLVGVGESVGTMESNISSSVTQLKQFNKQDKQRVDQFTQHLNITSKVATNQDQVLAARKSALDLRMQAIAQSTKAAQDEVTLAASRVKLASDTQNLIDSQRDEILNSMSDEQISAAEQQAKGTKSGTVNLNGVELTLGHLQEAGQQREDSNLATQSMILSNNAMIEKAAQIPNDRVKEQFEFSQMQRKMHELNLRTSVDKMGEKQLIDLAANGYAVPDGQGGKIQYPIQYVNEAMAKIVARSSSGDMNLLNIGSGLVNLQQIQTDITPRLQNITGNSRAFKRLRVQYANDMAQINSLMGDNGTRSEEQISHHVANLPPGKKKALSDLVSRVQKDWDAGVDKTIKSMYSNPVDQKVMSSWVNGGNISASDAAEFTGRNWTDAVPRDVDRFTNETIIAGNNAGMAYMKEILEPAGVYNPNMGMDQMMATMLALPGFRDRAKGEAKTVENIRMSAMRSKYNAVLSNEVIANSLAFEDSPLFGSITPTMVTDMLKTAEATAAGQNHAPNSQEFALAESRAFVRLMSGIQIGDQNAMDIFIQHINSGALASATKQALDRRAELSSTDYIIQRGAVGGSLLSGVTSWGDTLNAIYSQQKVALGSDRQRLADMFENPNQRGLAEMQLAGMLIEGANPPDVQKYLQGIAKKYGGNADLMWKHVQEFKEDSQAADNIRKELAKRRAPATEDLIRMSQLTGFPRLTSSPGVISETFDFLATPSLPTEVKAGQGIQKQSPIFPQEN